VGLVAAFQFLTAIPLRRKTSAEDMGRSLPFFPVVGLMLGGLLLGLDRLLELALPPGLVNILLVIALIVVTRALHLDGFIWTASSIPVTGWPAAIRRPRGSRSCATAVWGASGLWGPSA